jgi:hypothetical protein
MNNGRLARWIVSILLVAAVAVWFGLPIWTCILLGIALSLGFI